MLRTTSITLHLTTLVTLMLLMSMPSFAAVQGDVELLKTVAERHKANFEAILTLKGEALETRTSTRGDWYDLTIKNKCTFAYERLQDVARWNKYPQEYSCIKYGKPRPDILATYKNHNAVMLKYKSYYEYAGLEQPNDKNKVVHTLVIGPASMAKGRGGHCLDPRYFLADPGGATVHRRLMLIYDNANDEEAVGWSVKREGELVTLQHSPDETRISKNVYDLSAGANMVEYYHKTPTLEISQHYSYEQKSGVWILKSFKKTHVSRLKSGDIRKSTRSINWTNSVVNVPFEQDEFTVEKLGLKRGDLISDHRIKMGYRYEGFLRDPAENQGGSESKKP